MNEKKLIRQLTHKLTPIGGSGDSAFFLPNHSGDLSAGKVRTTPTQDLNPVNKKYVDYRNIQNANVISMGGGYAVSFDGTNECVNLGEGNSLDPGANDYSISLWVKTTDVDGLLYGADNGTGTYDITIRTTAGGIVRCYLRGSPAANYSYRDSTASVTSGDWTHLVITWSYSSREILFYINGANGQGVQTNNGATPDITMGAGRNYYIGYLAQNALYPLNGSVDETAVWGRVLTSDEVGDLYNGGTGLYINPLNNFTSTGTPISTNLKAIWHFDEGTGTSTSDSSGNGNTGTLTNMEEADWIEGKISTGPGGTVPIDVWKAEDGQLTGENGVLTYGDDNCRNVINGKTIRFTINGTQVGEMDSAGPKFDNLIITKDGRIKPTVDGTQAISISDAAATTRQVIFDTTNGRLGIGNVPSTKLYGEYTENSHNTPQIVFKNLGNGNSSMLALSAAGTGNPNFGFMEGTTAKGTVSWNVSSDYIGIANLAYSAADFSLKLLNDGSWRYYNGANGQEKWKIDTSGNNTVVGYVNAASYKVGGTAGASGSFTTTDGKTVTVTNGLITAIV